MSLRTRAILLLVGTAVVTLLAFAAIARGIVGSGFAQLEAADAEERIERIATALDAELEARSAVAREVAASTDAAAVLSGERSGPVGWRGIPALLERADVDAVVLVDPLGRIVHEVDRGEELPAPLRSLLRENTLRLPESGRNEVRAVASTGDELALVVSHVVRGDRVPLGVVITATRVDADLVGRLEDRAFVTMDLAPYAARTGFAIAPLAAEAIAVTEGDDWVAASGKLVNGVGGYVVSLSTEVPRAISAAGRTATTRLLLLILGSTVVSATFILLWFERRILSRMARLTELVTGSDGGPTRPEVRLDGDDELARLAHRIERTLTTLESAQEELRDTNAELAIANELKDDFVSMVSHEFRTPLTSIRGYADTILRYGDRLEPDKRQAFTERIAVQSVALTRMVDDLLTLSQVRRGTMRHEPEDVPVASVVARTLTDLHVEGIEVDLPDGVAVHADREHLRRILTNLIENARKYGEDPIRVSAAVAGGHVEVRVRDHGPGVEDAFVPALFDRFTQASMGLQRTAKGVGLGLSIVQTLAVLNGGDVWYEPADPGAVFALRLPRAVASPVSDDRDAARVG